MGIFGASCGVDHVMNEKVTEEAREDPVKNFLKGSVFVELSKWQ